MRVLIALFTLLTFGGTGSHRASAAVLIKIERSSDGTRLEGHKTHVIFDSNREIWVGFDSGLYSVAADSLTPVWQDAPVVAITAGLGNELWFGTQCQGIFAEDQGTVRPIHQDRFSHHCVNDLLTEERALKGRNTGIWVATDRGLYRISNNGVEVFISNEPVNKVKEGRAGILAATRSNIYRIQGKDSITPLLPSAVSVDGFTEIGDSLWITSRSRAGPQYSPCKEFDGLRLREYREAAPCTSVADVSGEAWLATGRGIWRFSGGAIHELEDYEGPGVNTILPIGDRIWIGTTRGAILRNGSEHRKIPADQPFLSVLEFVPINGSVWLRTDSGVYRFDENVDISAHPKTAFKWPLIDTPIVWGSNVHFAVDYETGGRIAYNHGIHGHFKIILGSDQSEVRMKAKNGAFQDAGDSLIRLSQDQNVVYWLAKDRFGNVSELNSMDLLVLPKAAFVIIPFIVIFLLGLAFSRFFSFKMSRRRSALGVDVEEPTPASALGLVLDEGLAARKESKRPLLIPFKKKVGTIFRRLSQAANIYARSKSLEHFYLVGYLLLGFILITLTTVGLLFGDTLSVPLQDKYPMIYNLLQALLSKTPFGDLLALPVPIATVFPLLWLSGLLIKCVRRFFGRYTTLILLTLISRGIAIGEWCILHRWASFIWMAGLVAYLTGGLVWVSTTERRSELLVSDYNTWLDHVEEFVLRNTLSRYDRTPHEELHRRYWRDDFARLYGDRSRFDAPGKALHDILETLYVKEKPYTLRWTDWIRENLQELFRLAGREYRPREKMVAKELREWALLQLLLGRLFARLGGDDCSDLDALGTSLRFLEAIDGEEDRVSPLLRKAATNAKGTVYSCFFSSRLKTSRENRPTANRMSAPRCETPAQCLEMSYTYYMDAAAGPPCSFQEKRLKNNVLDLLSRAGQQYNTVNKSILPGSPLFEYFSNRESLAIEIERRNAELMSCVSSEPILPEIFITGTQSLAIAAELHSSSDRQIESLEKSGQYLALAYAFLPDAFEEWSVEAYCSVLGSEDRRRAFEKGATSFPEEFVNFEMAFLIDRLERQCSEEFEDEP